MKILYSIQGTGNGHVSRAREIIPHLKKYGQLDLLLSGTQAEVGLEDDIKYQYKGFGYVFGKRGSIDFGETWKRFDSFNFLKEIRELPVNDYDLIINDFEPVTAWACKLRNKKSVALSHQSAFLSSKTPQLEGFHWGKFITTHYAPATEYFAFHFEKYDEHIYTPVIRSEVRNLKIGNSDHYTVYLPAYSDEFILNQIRNIPDTNWQIFSKHAVKGYVKDNAEVFPICNADFLSSLATSKGFLTGGGFEGPAEALFLGKKVLSVPMTHQYEQQCNALALEKMGIPVIWNQKEFNLKLKRWVESDDIIKVNYPDETDGILAKVIASR
ncbi:glycosyltransferase family protein [Chryseobacterium sp.]|uniref:glycosyltransferase family protein n=1 Tax=Chryseobacterium sp. TaxID=1871047 RepID=UPI0011C785B3|nr:glycosyltransferase family protein [Chryseobacterium sp.]TXF76324.1 glycosyl transferase [Chryseobacterium sp.]